MLTSKQEYPELYPPPQRTLQSPHNTFGPADRKILVAIANKLPIVTEWHTERHIVDETEFIDRYQGGEVEFKPFTKGPLKGKMIMNVPVLIYANHYRRLKKAYLKQGEPAIFAYIQKIKDMPVD